MIFDLYVPAFGWLQRLDPRTKIGLVALGVLLFILSQGVLPLALLVVVLHLALRLSAVPWVRLQWVFRQLRYVLLVILLIFPWMAALEGRHLVELGPLLLTDSNLHLAAATALRLWGMSLLVMALLFTTSQPELVRGMVALGLPYQWGLTLAIALRYIPSLTRQIEQIREAQSARGWDAMGGDLLKRLRGLAPLFVALTIHTFRTVDTLTMAMMARGVGRDTPRTVRRPLHMTSQDWFVLMGAIVGTAWIVRYLL